MNFYRGALISKRVRIGIWGKAASKSHTILRDMTGCDASIKNYSARYSMWRGTCVVRYSKRHPCSEMWRSRAMRRAYVGERIQPPGLEIPGENKLSGPGMTCCHSYGLVRLHRKTPPSIGPLLYVWAERSLFSVAERPQAWAWMLIKSLLSIVDWTWSYILSKCWWEGADRAEEIERGMWALGDLKHSWGFFF